MRSNTIVSDFLVSFQIILCNYVIFCRNYWVISNHVQQLPIRSSVVEVAKFHRKIYVRQDVLTSKLILMRKLNTHKVVVLCKTSYLQCSRNMKKANSC